MIEFPPRRRLIAIGIVVLLVIGVAAYFVRSQGRNEGAALYGNVDIREVRLAFRVAGRVDELLVDEGDAVRAGQVLARIDRVPLEQALKEASANAAAVSARMSLVQSGYRPQEIAQARANVIERRAALANADRLMARQEELSGTGAVAPRVYDDALAARDQARARLAAAEQALAQYVSGFREQEIAEASANQARAEAMVAQAQQRLDDATLLAPSDGVVLTRAAEKGAMLATGATVFTVSLTRPVWVRAYASEADLGRVAPGTAVLVSTDSRRDRPYHGRIGYVSPSAEFTPKNVETPDLRTSLVYRFRVVIEDPDDGLRQGMPVTVNLPAASESQGQDKPRK